MSSNSDSNSGSGSRKVQRVLSEQEARVLKMLQTWEELADNKLLTGTLEMNAQALEAVTHFEVARPLKIVLGSKVNTKKVTFNLVELARYMDYICDCVGFTVSINGEVTTKDGTKFAIPFSTYPTKLPGGNSRR